MGFRRMKSGAARGEYHHGWNRPKHSQGSSTFQALNKIIIMNIACLTRPLPPSHLSTETGLDGSDTAPTTAGVARDEVETVFSLVEFSIGASTGLAGDVFD